MNGSIGISEIIDQLELFSETVSRVHDSGFIRDLKCRKRIGFKLSVGKDRPFELMRNWPAEDLVNGFLLPFRMLIQKRDPSSWRQIGELVETLEVPAKYKDAFREARINLNDFLDNPTIDSSAIKFAFPGAPESNRDILYTFLYGYYAHADEIYRKRLEQWRQRPTSFIALEFEFINIIIKISDLSYRMSEQINKPMIEFLRRNEVRA